MAWALNATPTAGAGTVSVPANAQFNTATTLTGVGTAFAAGLAGQMIIIGNFAARINTVVSGTQLTLDRSPQMAINAATYSTVSGTVRVVQTGTDTNTTGLSAIAGVQTRTLSEHTEYIVPYLMQIDGTWTQTYREKLSMVRRVNNPDWLPTNDSGEIVVNGTWNWGEFVTINGVTVARETLPLTFSQQAISAWQNTQRNSVVVNASGRLNWIGARIKASTLFWVNGGYFFGREVIVDRQETDMSNDQQFRFLNGATIDIIGIKVYRGCFTVDSRNTSINVVNFKGYEPIHVTKAMTWSGVANSYTITDGTVSTPVGGRLVIEDYNGKGCTLDHGTWVNGLADFVNPVNGTNITSAAHLGGQFASEGHTRVYSSARFNHTLPNGTALQNVITYMADNATGADIPYNLTLKYVLTSNASGNSEGQFLTGYRYVPKNALQVIRPTIRRSISQADDIYTFYHGGYDIIPFASSNNLIGSGQKQFAYTDALDTNVTLSRTNALALLGTKFTISGTTITVNQNATYDELYDATKAFKFQGTTTAFETPTVSSLILTASGGNLTAFAGWTLVVNTGVTLSSGAKFGECYFDTITLNGTGKITAVYATTAGTSTVLELNPPSNDYSLCIFKADGTTKYFQSNVNAGSYYVYFTPAEAGTYYLAAEKYGQKRTADTLVLNGGNVWYNITDQEDVGITDNFATASALTTVSTTSQMYDVTAIFRLTEIGIKLGQLVARDGLYLDFADKNVKIKDDATSIIAVVGDTITYKSIVINATTKYNAMKATPPKTITPTDTEIINVLVEDANGDSKLSILGGDNLGYELWKITTATPTDNYATGTLLDTLATNDEIFRFIGISGFDIVGRDTSSGVRRRSSMLKGTYEQAFYVGNQIQLATDAPQLIENNQKLDELLLKVDTKLDVAVSTRLADADYVEPDNTKIGQIKSKVDTLENTNLTGIATSQNVLDSKAEVLEAIGDIPSTDISGLALEVTAQSIKTTVEALENYDDQVLIDKVDAIQTSVDNIDVDFTPVLDAVATKPTLSQIEAGKVGDIKTKVDTLQNADFGTTNSKIDAVKAKVDTLNNYNDATAQTKLDGIKAKTDTLVNTNLTGIATATDVQNAKDSIETKIDNIVVDNDAIAAEVWSQEPDRLKQVATVETTGDQLASFNHA
jgi:hypothetical protein